MSKLDKVKSHLLSLEPGTVITFGRWRTQSSRDLDALASKATVRKALKELCAEYEYDEGGQANKYRFRRLSPAEKSQYLQANAEYEERKKLVQEMDAAGISALPGRQGKVLISCDDARLFLRLKSEASAQVPEARAPGKQVASV